MRYFTRAWCSEDNDATVDAVREDYWRQLSLIADRLSAAVRQLAYELDLHQARLRGYAHDPVIGWLGLSLRVGDLQRGYENLTLTYWLAELEVIEVPELARLLADPQTEVSCDEVELLEEGRYEHRLLLAPVGELAIRFQALTYQRQPVATGNAP